MNKVVCVLFDAAGENSALEWAHQLSSDGERVLTGERTLTDVLSFIASSCKETGAKAAVFSYADCPLLDAALTEMLIDRHFKYSAEYTFADGYPYGLAPEVIDAGTAGILLELSRTVHDEMGKKQMTRTAIMDLIKTDINAFEVETVISIHDWRLWRLSFYTGSKRERIACEALLPYKKKGFNADALCQAAVKEIDIVRTVPAFYEIGLSGQGNEGFMPLDKLSYLVRQIKELSESAVVSLSAEGEPLKHPEFVKAVALLCDAELDVLVETNGQDMTEEEAAACKAAQIKSGSKVMWVVKIADGVQQTSDGGTDSKDADGVVAMLNKHFPGEVYPQLVRTNATEGSLEAFYRKWSAADSPSSGKVLIKKWCTYCGTLPDEKPCDLSPLVRNPCWHLRRDMVILHDGTVPLCFARVHLLDDKANVAGNAFAQTLSDIWDGMKKAAAADLNGERDTLCRKCDEYYTFNF